MKRFHAKPAAAACALMLALAQNSAYAQAQDDVSEQEPVPAEIPALIPQDYASPVQLERVPPLDDKFSEGSESPAENSSGKMSWPDGVQVEPAPSAGELLSPLIQVQDSEGLSVEEGPLDKRDSVMQIVTSRSVTMPLGQYLEVVYPGAGWSYLGETDKQGSVVFFGRKTGGGNSTFTLLSRRAGKVTLHFYKNDGLTGKYIDDYLEVTVTEEKGSPEERTVAPDYAQIVPPRPDLAKFLEAEGADEAKPDSAEKKSPAPEAKEPEPAKSEVPEKAEDKGVKVQPEAPKEEPKPAKRPEPAPARPKAPARPESKTAQAAPTGDTKVTSAEAKAEPAQTPAPKDDGKPAAQKADETVQAAEKAEPAKPAASPQDLLAMAQKAYDEKKFKDALDCVRGFLGAAEEGLDKGLFLQGQILEANSEARNIKGALDSYRSLTANYPASPLWQKANERAIYLQRFYYNKRS